MAKFQRLAFGQPLEDSLSITYYKSQFQQFVNEVFKFNDLVVDEIHKEIESFLKIFNNAFEARQLHSQHTANIAEIESSIEQDRNKLIQAWEGFQKAKEKIMLIQGPIDKAEAELTKKEEELMVLLGPIQEDLHSTHLKLQELWSNKEINEQNKNSLYSIAKKIM